VARARIRLQLPFSHVLERVDHLPFCTSDTSRLPGKFARVAVLSLRAVGTLILGEDVQLGASMKLGVN